MRNVPLTRAILTGGTSGGSEMGREQTDSYGHGGPGEQPERNLPCCEEFGPRPGSATVEIDHRFCGATSDKSRRGAQRALRQPLAGAICATASLAGSFAGLGVAASLLVARR